MINVCLGDLGRSGDIPQDILLEAPRSLLRPLLAINE